MTEPLIEATGLAKAYRVHEKAPGLMGSIRSLFARNWRTVHAVRGVDLRVDEGEILGLVGANGAGKTTLVKMMAGIVHPTGGSVRVLGYDPWARDDRMRRQIALIMGQKAQLWWDLPAADCFLLLREIYGVAPTDFQRTLDELTDLLDVRDLLNIQIRRLSLGERMKMELIAALLHRPRVVFLDEPTIGLDVAAQRAIRDFLLHYRDTHRPAMILTSHYMEDIARLCPRIAIVADGAKIFDGPLREVIEEHATHKILVAQLDGLTEAPDLDGLPLGPSTELVSVDRLTLRLRAPRADVATVASAVLGALPVADLAIEELDIADIIEHIFRSGRRPAHDAAPTP